MKREKAEKTRETDPISDETEEKKERQDGEMQRRGDQARNEEMSATVERPAGTIGEDRDQEKKIDDITITNKGSNKESDGAERRAARTTEMTACRAGPASTTGSSPSRSNTTSSKLRRHLKTKKEKNLSSHSKQKNKKNKKNRKNRRKNNLIN